MKIFTNQRLFIVVSSLIILCPKKDFGEMTREWVKVYNGNGRAKTTSLNAMAVDDSGYVYITGNDLISSPTPNISDLYLVKYNTYGDSVWHRIKQGANNVYNSPIGFAVDFLGHIYLCILDGASGIPYFPTIIKYGAEGDIRSTNSFDETDYYSSPRLMAFDKGLDRTLLVCEQMHISGKPKKVSLLGINFQLNLAFKTYYDQPANPDYPIYPRAITFDENGSVYIAGYYEYLNGQGWFILKYRVDGFLLWDRLFNEITFKSNKTIDVTGITVDKEKNVFVCGHGYNLPPESREFFVVKYDMFGKFLWKYIYNSGGDDFAKGIVVDKLGYCYVTGSGNPSGSSEMITIKLNKDGGKVWERHFKSPTAGAYPADIAIDKNDNIYITGHYSNEVLTVCYGPLGDTLWWDHYDHAKNKYDEGRKIIIDSSGNVYVGGRTQKASNVDEILLIKHSDKSNKTIIELVDPIPDLIEKKKIITSKFQLSKWGKIVNGAVADGACKILIRVNTAKPALKVKFELEYPEGGTGPDDEMGSFSTIEKQDEKVKELELSTIYTEGGNFIYAIFNAPLDFVRTGFESKDKNEKRRKVNLKVTVDGEPITKEIEIHRPPLLFVHGLWSSRSCWDDFYPLASPDGSKDSRFTSYFADYSESNDREIMHNTPKVLKRLTETIDDYKEKENIACVQADLIVHSMGGLISRAMPLYTNKYYFSDGNYGKGYIHKLITFDTPHDGAEICDFLFGAYTSLSTGWQVRLLLQPILKFLGLSASVSGISAGAIEDMIPGSPTMNLINSSYNVPIEPPCHRFAADASTAAKISFGILIAPVQVVLLSEPTGLFGIFGTHDHDLCVTIWSQRGSNVGAFTPGSLTDVYDYTHFDGLAFDYVLEKKSSHAYKTIDLLNLKRNTPFFSSNGRDINEKYTGSSIVLNTNNKTMRNVNLVENKTLSTGDTLISIISPVAGTTASWGDVLDVVVGAKNGVELKKVWIAATGFADVDSTEPFSFRLPVFAGIDLGRFNYFVFAEDKDGNIFVDKNENYLSTESWLNIKTNQPLLYMTLGNDKVINIRSNYDRKKVSLTGLFPDSIWCNITNDDNTSFKNSNPTVAIFNNGFIEGKSNGSTTLVFKNSGFSDTLVVNVDMSYQEPIAIANKDTTLQIGGTVLLDASQSIYQDGLSVNYNWEILSKPEGSNATISDVNSINSSFIVDIEGEYLVKLLVEDEKGGYSLDQAMVYVVKPLSVEDNYTNLNRIVQIIPHPVTGESKIIIPVPDNENLNLTIYNTIGAMIFQKNIVKLKGDYNNVILSAEDFETGMYYMIIKNEKINYSQKFVVVK